LVTESTDLRGILENAMATTHQAESSVPELQAAFGSILLARPTPAAPPPSEPPSYIVGRGCSGRGIPPWSLDRVQLPKWTGAFKLFDFPRELRDRIFHYVVYRPEGIYYNAHRNPDLKDIGPCEDAINLFLVSKQVYHEAMQAFGRSNTIALSAKYSPREGLHKPPSGLLRLFPDRAAATATKIRHLYHDTVPRPYGRYGIAPSHNSLFDGGDGTGHFRKRQQPGLTFLEILRDAHILTQHFPKLSTFEAAWEVGPGFYEYPIPECVVRDIATFLYKGGSHEEAVDMWLHLMRGWMQGANVVPLACIWFECRGFGADGFGEDMDDAANEAYQKVVKELQNREDIEASGALWLEEMEEASRSGKKKSKGKTARK